MGARSEPSEDQIAEGLRGLGLPAPEDREYRFHDFSGADMAEAFRAGWAARDAIADRIADAILPGDTP